MAEETGASLRSVWPMPLRAMLSVEIAAESSLRKVAGCKRVSPRRVRLTGSVRSVARQGDDDTSIRRLEVSYMRLCLQYSEAEMIW